MSTPNIVKDQQQLLDQVNEFTNLETVGLDVWADLREVHAYALAHDLRDVHAYALAHDVLYAALSAEHWRAEISEDPAQITPEQLAEYRRRLKVFDDLLHQAGAQTGRTYGR